jgi:hypothetical protein
MRNQIALPIGANVVLSFKDEPKTKLNRYISFGKEVFEGEDVIGDDYGVPDTDIFYFMDGIEEWTQVIRAGHYEWDVHKWDFVYDPSDIVLVDNNG